MFENSNFNINTIRKSQADKVDITNVVVTATIDKELNLESVAEQLDECKYNPQNFPGLPYTTSNGASVTFFESGSINLTGISSDEEFEEAREELEEELDLLFDEYTITYELANVVTTVEYQNYYVEELMDKLRKDNPPKIDTITYHPEELPCIVWHIKTDDVEGILLVFKSGKILIPELTDTDDIYKLLQEFEETMLTFKRTGAIGSR